MNLHSGSGDVLATRTRIVPLIRMVAVFTLMLLLTTYVLLWFIQIPDDRRWVLWNTADEYTLSAFNYVIGYHFFNLAWPAFFSCAPWHAISKQIEPRAIMYSLLPVWAPLVIFHLMFEIYRTLGIVRGARFWDGGELIADAILQLLLLGNSLLALIICAVVSHGSKRWGKLHSGPTP